jgi:rare lipoprotein A
MIWLRPFSAIAATVLILLLSGCAGRPQAPSTGEPAAHPQGVYKTGQPYQVNGVWYYPSDDLTYDETGIASWYGPNFQEKFTANGEVFDQNAVSAAHKTLPLPCVVQVTNLDNGRTIEVRVNDRGPFVGTRIIDLSRRAAQLLGFEQAGTAKVRVKVLVPESIQAASIARAGSGAVAAAEAPSAAPRAAIVAEALSAPNARPGTPPPTASPPPPAAVPSPPVSAAPAPLSESVSILPVKPSHIFIQAGAYASGTNAVRMKEKLEALGPVVVAGARVNGMDIFRVRLGPVATVDEADQLLARAVGVGAIDAKIVVDTQS